MPAPTGGRGERQSPAATQSARADVARHKDSSAFAHCCCEPASTLFTWLARSHSVSDFAKE
eukprot:12978117-Alexandrium_andersonii.AAC.1